MVVGVAKLGFFPPQASGGATPIGSIVPFTLDPGTSDLLGLSSSGASIAGPSLSPPADTDIFVVLFSRRNAAHTHSSVTAGFNTVGGFSSLVSEIGTLETSGQVRASIWRATTTSSPGSGVITGNYSATAYQRGMAAVRLSDVDSVQSTLSAGGTDSGATISDTFSPGLATTDIVLAAFVQNQTTGAKSWDDGLTMLDGGFATVVPNMGMGVAWRNGGASDTQGVSGIHTTNSRALVAAALRGA